MSGKIYVLPILVGNANDDNITLATASKLHTKSLTDEFGCLLPGQISQRILLSDGACLRSISEIDKLYVVAHGTYGVMATVANKTAEQFARYLFAQGLRAFNTMVLVSCNSGWSGLLGFSYPSFAERAVTAIKQCHIYGHEVRAYIGYVIVTRDGHKIVTLTKGNLYFLNHGIRIGKGYNRRSFFI
jgi:hypothetical protein